MTPSIRENGCGWWESSSQELQAAARTLGLQLHLLNASTELEIDTAFATMVQLRAGGLVIAADALSRAESNSSRHWRSATGFQQSTNFPNSLRRAGL
jgi:hypothetical protein